MNPNMIGALTSLMQQHMRQGGHGQGVDVMQGQTPPEMPGNMPGMAQDGGGTGEPDFGPPQSLMSHAPGEASMFSPEQPFDDAPAFDPGSLQQLMTGADGYAEGGDDGYGNAAALQQQGVQSMGDPSADSGYSWQGGPQGAMPLGQEQGDLWAPQAQSIQSMFASSPAMGGRMTTK